MVEWIIGLAALTAMEIVLGIDNIVFITIVSSKLPKEQQPLARRLGLALALISRLALLWLLFSIVHGGEFFEKPVFKLTDVGIPKAAVAQMSSAYEESSLHGTPEHAEDGGDVKHDADSGTKTKRKRVINEKHFAEADGVSLKDLILLFGGLFLLGKSVWEIHDELGNEGHHENSKGGNKLFVGVLVQIAILDIVFSLDSVITAVGMVEQLSVMVVAIILAVIVMLIFSEPISRFVESHPTLKMLALSFLILIGVMLIAEGVGAHMDKGYIYFAMCFALIVEVLNIRLRGKPDSAVEAAQ
jgi:predicted tellurium resistance membrane protein TerC